MTTDTQQPQLAGQASVRRYLQEETTRRSEALFAESEERVRALRAECEVRKQELLEAGRRDSVPLERSLTVSIVGPAKRDADAMASRKMGEAVERILEECRDRLRVYSTGSAFSATLEVLIGEVVTQARDLLRADRADEVKGRLSVAPGDLDLCRRIVERLGLALDVQADDSVWGGVELLTAEGRYRLRNTLESRMQKQESRLREVATRRIQEGVSRMVEVEGPR